MFEQLPSVSERNAGDAASDAFLVIDSASGGVSYANAAAADLFDASDATFATVRAADLLDEFADLAPREFEARFEGAGRRYRLAVRLERLFGGSGHRDASLIARIRLGAEAEGARAGDSARGPRSERLESLWSLVVRRGFAGTEQVKALLREGAAGLGLGRATLARLDGDELVVDFAWPTEDSGARVPLERSLSHAALSRSGTFAVLDTRVDPAYRRVATDVRCFLASAFRVGDERWVLTVSSVVARQRPFDDGDWGYIENLIEALARGIERSERDARIERLAYSDALTALPNRIAALGRLDDALAEAEDTGTRVAVLFLDIDGFKNVNDTVGHRAGDAVLAEVAQRLRGTLRRQEYIGRLGGDEFAIVMPHVAGRDEIESIAHRIGGVLSFPFAVDEQRFSLSASIGVAVYPDDATGRDDLLACADAAMYAAKEDGGSRVRFREHGADAPAETTAAQQAFVTSEPRDVGYVLWYEPILDLRTGRVEAVQALIGRIDAAPARATDLGSPVALDTAARRALDRWMVREAMSRARTWHDAGASSLRIDVTMAALDLGDFEALLSDDEAARDVRRLRIVIAPERFADPDETGLRAFVLQCAKRGVAFALDDFDGGLQMLASLSDLPIEAVKLERSVGAGVVTSRAARAVVQGTATTAKALGWRVVAKGVETAAERDALASLGCDEIAGNYVAQPMNAAEFGQWLVERACAGREA